MKYYGGNALYDNIRNKGINSLKFVVGNAWQLIYGDEYNNPKLLVMAVGCSIDEYKYGLPNQYKEDFELLETLSENTGIPLAIVLFRTDISEISEVKFGRQDSDLDIISLSQLSKVFGKYGLPVSDTETAKYLNDKSSSAYHDWQRQSLGHCLTVSDLDLWRVGDNGRPQTIYELKRSYYPLKRWQPFRDDFGNFELIAKVCNLGSINFKIIYNVREKHPFYDDVSSLKVYNVDFNEGLSIKEEGIVSLDNFLWQ